MKKKIIFLILGIFLLVGVGAIITLSDGSKLLGKDELKEITNQQISTYMENNLQITRYKLLDEKIIVYYNITYLEPTHKDYIYNDSNNVTQTITDTYRVFTQEKPFIISMNLWEFCLNKTTTSNCRDYLVDRETPYYLIENNSYELDNQTFYEVTNTTIKSTYLQAYEEQVKQYLRARKFRNKTIYNELQELVDLI